MKILICYFLSNFFIHICIYITDLASYIFFQICTLFCYLILYGDSYAIKYSLEMPFKWLCNILEYVFVTGCLIILIILDIWLASNFQPQGLYCTEPFGTKSHGREFVSQWYQLFLGLQIYIVKVFLRNLCCLYSHYY